MRALNRRAVAVLCAIATVTAAAAAHAGTTATTNGEPVPNGHAQAGGSGGGLVLTATPPPGYPVTGIDVSNHQGVIDWTSVAAAGAKFTYAKATEGVRFVDGYFDANNRGAKANGLFAGAYHFALPARSTGRAQADYFLDHAQYISDGRTLPPMLDIEWPWTGSGSPSPCYGLSPAQMSTWIRDFVDRVRQRTGRPTMIYTNVNWWNPCTGNNASFGDNPLFIARYASSPGTLPAGWSRWTLWQYFNSGSLPGDQDVFNGSLSDLARLAGSTIGPSLSGDGPAELVHMRIDGVIHAYRNGRGLDGWPWTSEHDIGFGWENVDPARVRFADLDGDGRVELIHVRADGVIHAYRNGLGLDGWPWTSEHDVGFGWTGDPGRVRFADIDGDGRAELIDLRLDGTIHAYRNGRGLDGWPWTTEHDIGFGWTDDPQRVRFADLTGDGRAELIDLRADGVIHAYRNGRGLDGWPWTSEHDIGFGWTGDPGRVRFADVDGDARAELVHLRTDGVIHAYRNAQGLDGWPWTTEHDIGLGWTDDPLRIQLA